MNEINSNSGNIDKISGIKPDINLKKSQLKGDGSFNKILSDQMDQADKNPALSQATSLLEIQGSFNAQKINFELDKTQFTKKLDSSLNMLELYATMLQDPDKTLKQAWNLLEQLTNETKTLELEFKNNKFANLDLKNILTQLLTTVEVENIKFNRGDYA